MTTYNLDAKKFLRYCKTEMKIEFIIKRKNLLWNENEPRNCYKVTLSNDKGFFKIRFWDSIYNTENNILPDEYDILSSLQKYDPGSYQNFCSEYGYEESPTSKKIYLLCQQEYIHVEKIFSPKQIEMLRKIY